VVAIGCSAVLVFIILLVVSLCCCCCARRKKTQLKQQLPTASSSSSSSSHKKGELTSKLVIKNFPIVTQNGNNNFDYSDSSAKSSQQHILNGSGTHSTSSSTSGGPCEYTTKHEPPTSILFDTNLPNKYGLTTTSYKIEYAGMGNSGVKNMATVESDSSSSTSLENKTISTSNGGKSSTAHSPFTVLNENGAHGGNANNNTGGHYFSAATNSYSNFHPKNSLNKPTPNGLLYNGPTNVYIKTYHPPQQQHHQQPAPSSNQSGSDHSQESCYSTPIITHNVNGNKKLVYEVIV
jgi:hypothetical protein